VAEQPAGGGETGEVGHEEEGKERDGHRQVGSSWGNDWERKNNREKNGNDWEKNGNDWEKKEWLRKEWEWLRKEGMTDLSSCFLPLLFPHQLKSIWIPPKFEFNPYAVNQIKLMHQHECTNMLKLK
jgi:hypothetical protein